MNRLTKGKALFGATNELNAIFTVGTEAADAINVAVQLKDGNGQNCTVRHTLAWYLSSNANGDALASATDGGIAIGTDGLLIEAVTNLAGFVTSEADGDIDVTLTESGTGTWYLVLVMPNAALKVSGAITFA